MAAIRLVCVGVFLLTMAFLCSDPASAKDLEFRHAVRGEINLKGWTGEPSLQLHGEWSFFWNEFLSPEDFLQRLQRSDGQARFLEVGKSFSASDPERIPGNSGYGTFVLRVRGLPTAVDLAYRGLSAYSASQVYFFDANGKGGETPRGAAGQVGTDASSMVPRMQNQAVRSLGMVSEQDHFFLIHVSNFHHRKGGLWLPPEIGVSTLLQEGRDQEIQSNYFFMGMMAFIVLYNLSFYSRRVEDKGPLWLALTATVLLVRSFSYAESQFEFLGISPTSSFELRWTIFYTTITLAPMLFIQFASSYFPAQLPPRIIRRLWLVAVPCMLFVLVTPTRIFSHFVNPITLAGSLIGLFSIYGQIRAAHAQEKGALISLLGSILVFIGSMLDLLWSKGFTFLPTNCSGITITLFVMAQSQIVAVRFAAAFRQAEHLSRELQREVEKQTRDIKSILRSIKQGIFTLVQPHRTVGSQYSDHLREIVGKDRIEGETLNRLLLDDCQMSTEDKNLIDAALGASIGEDGIAFEANEHCLVREVDYIPPGQNERRHLEMEWTPIPTKDGSVEKVLVCVRDVTELRVLRQQADQRGADLRMIQDLVNLSEDRFQRFVRTTLDYLEQSRAVIRDEARIPTESLRRLFINMHTIKGSARMFHLHAVSGVAHEIEQDYTAIQAGAKPWDSGRLLEDLDRVQAVVFQYQDAGRNKLSWDLDNQILRLPRGRVLLGLEQLQSLRREGWSLDDQKVLGEVEAMLMEHCYASLHAVIQDVCAGLDALARDLGKPRPQVECALAPFVLQESGADLIQSVMPHLLRNSMDHGLEQAEARQALGKPAQGRIVFKAVTQGSWLQIDLVDDGAGLDLDRIRQLALASGRLKPDHALSDLELADLIFEDGLSTKDEVTLISGRGVGMSAVRSLMSSKGGRIAVLLPNPAYERGHAPILLRLLLPQHLWSTPGQRTARSEPLGQAV